MDQRPVLSSIHFPLVAKFISQQIKFRMKFKKKEKLQRPNEDKFFKNDNDKCIENNNSNNNKKKDLKR